MSKLSISTHLCRECHQQFASIAEYQQHQQTECKVKRELVPLALNVWSVFLADSVIPNLPLPQQAEAEVCGWLRFMASKLDLIDNYRRLYGKIVFDPMGELYDFDIRKLDYEMLNLGFTNWMNTLSSGEVLLDIVNGLISQICTDIEEPSTSLKGVVWRKLPVSRMLFTAPNKSATCTFLRNHDCLLGTFLEPIVKALRPTLLYLPGKKPLPPKPGTANDIRQTLQMVRHIGHTLLRNSYTTREWTWKALMLVVMTIMALTGSLGEGLERLFSCLTGEASISNLIVPELQQAYRKLKDSKLFTPADIKAIQDLQCCFPYKRVLKQGQIAFKSKLEIDFELS